MKKVLVYEMSYDGQETGKPKISCVPFDDSYTEEYMTVYNDCFYPMRKALDIKPYRWYSESWQLSGKTDNINLLLKNDEIVGSVACYGNEIDDLFVRRRYQNKGYGKQLLQWAIHQIRSQNDDPVVLHAAQWNQKAVSMYQQAGFVVSKEEYRR